MATPVSQLIYKIQEEFFGQVAEKRQITGLLGR